MDPAMKPWVLFMIVIIAGAAVLYFAYRLTS